MADLPRQVMLINIEALGVDATCQVHGQQYNPSVQSDLVAQTLKAWREAYDHIYLDGAIIADDVEAEILQALEDGDAG